MDPDVVKGMAQTISDLLAEKYRVGGRTFEKRINRVGRMLPKKIRKAAADLLMAEKMASDINLVRILDARQVQASYDRCFAFLDPIDPAELRSKARYYFATKVIFKILFVVGLFFAILYWRGYV